MKGDSLRKMNRSIVILSSMVDTTIKETCPMDRVLLFNTITDLMNYIESTPVRAETMYITKEVLNPSVNTSLALLMSLLNNPFLVIDEILYITEKESKELSSIKFMLEENKNLNWTTQFGSMTREYVMGTVAGTLRSEDFKPQRVSVFRQKKSDFIKEKVKEELTEPYPIDEAVMSGIPDEEIIPVILSETNNVCKTVTVSGLSEKERTVFSLLIAQYLSFQGKTLIVERDYDYLTLTDMMARADIAYKTVRISDIFFNPDEVLRSIRLSEDQLILVTEGNREFHDYSFVCNFLYNNLVGSLNYLVMEKELNEVAQTTSFITVIPGNMVDILRTVEKMPPLSLDKIKFAIINMKTLSNYNIPNTIQAKIILSDLLQYEELDVQNINVKSLRLGGEAHDLRMFIE